MPVTACMDSCNITEDLRQCKCSKELHTIHMRNYLLLLSIVKLMITPVATNDRARCRNSLNTFPLCSKYAKFLNTLNSQLTINTTSSSCSHMGQFNPWRFQVKWECVPRMQASCSSGKVSQSKMHLLHKIKLCGILSQNCIEHAFWEHILIWSEISKVWCDTSTDQEILRLLVYKH